jgi:3-methyl-2-oxobutanoate hydroxymethyltransferase
MSRTTIPDLAEKYAEGTPLTMLTAYDAQIARQVDRAGVDMVLVGDSAGDNHLGYDDTLPVTLEEALSNTGAVVRGTDEAFVVADMPFLTYGTSVAGSVENAGRFLKEEGADAVKVETAPYGETTIEIVDRLTELGVPVQGHIGYTPQRTGQIGGAYVQGRDTDTSTTGDALVETAQRLEKAGAFSIVLETVSEPVAKRITDAVDVPTIGIGSGRYVDGQVLVITDVLGLGGEPYSLSKQYADLDSAVRSAVEQYVAEVESGAFPTAENAFDPVEDEDGASE